MSRLECVGRSSKQTPREQETLQMSPACIEPPGPQGHVTVVPETVGEKPPTDYPRRSQPVTAVTHSMKNGPPVARNVLSSGEPAPEKSRESISGIGKKAGVTVFSNQVSNRNDNSSPKQSKSQTIGKQICASPSPAVLIPSPESEEEEDCTEEEEQGEGYQAPLELMAEFLKSVMEKDYLLAKKLCQMILIYEPENPEATQFLLLIQDKLLTGSRPE
ncbi:glutamate-rich protein 2 isoform X2 [Hypomesus transpacificus]|uniref:glutamate-rich protein 2 isoform X2 n=1 Tax=Hypomesus transpacificus TaxID=137520 RepID=UPI001F087742|nr:glutamate-rich protein 2 isoform X2 [Hypomesus transpacificus]